MNGWQDSTIGAQCHVIAGQSPPGKFYNDTGSGLPFYQGKKDFGEKFIGSPTKWTTHTTKEAHPGDILMSVRAPVGPINFSTQKICIGRGLAAIRPGDRIDKDFLFYALLSIQDEINGNEGAVFASINKKQIEGLRLPLPSLPEQKRIVAILDDVFAGITEAVANAEKNLANAHELFESYLNNVFSKKGEGWIEKSVGEIADHCLGKMLDKKKNKGSLKPYLRNLNVRWFDIDLSDLLEMRFEKGEEDRYSAIKGDLLICEGGYPGRAAIWQDDEPIFFQKAIHRVRFKEPSLNRWLMYFLYLSNATGNLRQYFTGAGIQHFTGQSLKRFQLPIAPLSEISLHLANFDLLFEETHHLESIYQKKINAFADLKQSILQKAFTGELTANSVNQQLVN